MAATAVVEPAHEPTKTGSPLLDRLWHAARSRGDSAPTADLFVAWARRFILFHDRRHPRELELAHVTHFLEHVAKTEREPLPALAQARAALALIYERVVGADLGELPWPRPPRVLDQLRLLLRVRHYSRSTEDCRWLWLRAARHAKHGLQRVERTGADVAKNHAKGCQAQCCRLEVV